MARRSGRSMGRGGEPPLIASVLGMSNMRGGRKARAIRVLWISEVVLLMSSVLLAAWIRFGNDPSSHVDFAQEAPIRALLVAFCITGAMTAFGLYQVHVRHSRVDFMLRAMLSFLFGGVALVVIYYAVPQSYMGRGVLALSLMIGFVGIVALRMASVRLIRSDVLKQRLLVVGAGSNANLINSRMRRVADRRSFLIVGFVPVRGQPLHVQEDLLLQPGESIASLAERLHADEVIVALDDRRGQLPMEEMLECVQHGIAVTDISTFFEREAGMVQLSVTDPSSLVFWGGFDYSAPRRLSKRCFDLVAAGLLLAITWPLMLLVALAVRLESPGPVLYRQVRVGERGRHFTITKFRSMRCDAEKDGVAMWATKDDDRSTRVGRIIRLTRMDELPQLWAVLRGDMSFVGPRPERPHFVDQLDVAVRYYGVRHCVKPGLTGWAQLRYPYGASVDDAEEKLKFDLFYVKNQGFVFDLMILIQTVEVVLFGRGAR